MERNHTLTKTTTQLAALRCPHCKRVGTLFKSDAPDTYPTSGVRAESCRCGECDGLAWALWHMGTGYTGTNPRK